MIRKQLVLYTDIRQQSPWYTDCTLTIGLTYYIHESTVYLRLNKTKTFLELTLLPMGIIMITTGTTVVTTIITICQSLFQREYIIVECDALSVDIIFLRKIRHSETTNSINVKCKPSPNVFQGF